MKNPYAGLWILLSSALLLFTILSSFDSLEVYGHDLKKATIYEELTKVADTCNVNSNTRIFEDQVTTAKVVDKIKIKTDSLPKSILFIGDSMLEGLSPRMASYAKKNGHKINSVIWYSSTSETWGKSDTLRYFIRKFKPNYILISLGANELFVKDIKKKRDKYVKSILKQIGNIPYVWIGPPNWKDDTGINELIAKNVNGGSFFLTRGMKFDRAKDGAHPTRSSAIVWMDSVVSWINLNGNHPILLNRPDVNTSRTNSTIILQPSR